MIKSARTLSASALLFAFSGIASHGAAEMAANNDAGAWNVTEPRGETREIDFVTDEGTWMSVDLSPDGSWLVFDMLGQIYRLPASGGEAETLTQNSGVAVNYHPRISPDGREIAFISDRGGQDNLWVMNADGGGLRQITDDMDARFAEPAWTPDGMHIITTKRAKTGSGFYRTNDSLWSYPRAGGEGKPLVSLGPSGDSAPARSGLWSGNARAQWASVSPDGAKLYFHSSTFIGGDRRLRRLDIASGEIEDVTRSKVGFMSCCGRSAYPSHMLELAPEISPDGRYLAFARRLPSGRLAYRDKEFNARTTLWLRDLETGEDRMVLDPISNTVGELHPAWQTRALPGYAWAKDGKSIVISQGGKLRRLWIGNGEVETIAFTARVHRTISQQARGHVRIVSDEFKARAIRWPAVSPNGEQLIFEAIGKLFVQRVSGGVPKPLTDETPDVFQMTPGFSPDGATIAFASWNDTKGGAVWVVPHEGGAPRQISTAPGRYFHPHWSDDGKFVFASFWPAALDYDPGGPPQWRQVRIPVVDGEQSVMSVPNLPRQIAPGRDGAYWAQLNDKLVYAASASAKPRPVATIIGAQTGAQALPSPDGKWIALWRFNDVYVAKMPKLHPGETPEIDVVATGKRLSLEGGYYPVWRNAHMLDFSGAASQSSYDVNSGELISTPIDLTFERATPRGTIALTGARIITLENRKVIERGSIVIKDDRIACVGKCDLNGIDRRISLKGKTIIPGLVDTHAHSLSDELMDGILTQHRHSSAAYLAYGVTTVFDPATFGILHSFTLSEAIEAGRIVGPRTFSTGTTVTCGAVSDVKDLSSFTETMHQVNRLADLGVISVKDYKQCTRLQRTWLAEAARRRHVSLTSEGSDYNYLLGLIMTGHAGFEHSFMVKPTYSDLARFLGQARAHYSPQVAPGGDYPEGAPIEYWFSRKDLWFDEKIMRWNPWQEIAVRRTYTKKPINDYGMQLQSETAADIKRAGGYATTGGHGEMGGLDTHWETWIHQFSMTQMEALEASSHDGAHFLGLEDEIGSLAVGKLADLVVLNHNPLKDIRNTTDILYVMKGGRLFNSATLDEIWPTPRPYGPRPWINDTMTATDIKSENVEGN